MKKLVIGVLCSLAFLPSPACAAGNGGLPDELTVTVDIGVDPCPSGIDPNEGGLGENSYVRSNVEVVLHKRSMRSDNYLCVVWTDDGFKKIDPFPVSTYRGYVKDDPMIQVNGNIEPGGILNLNFSENRGFIARIRHMKIDLPSDAAAAGKSTRTMSAGNKVIPLSSVKQRPEVSPGGYLVPRVPMRRTKWLVKGYQSYTQIAPLETVVSEIEQRWNDGDFVYARDMGVAWEIETMVLVDPKAKSNLDLSKLCPDEPDRRTHVKEGGVTGRLVGRNQGKMRLNVRGRFHEARILLHESAHVYGNALHQFGEGDGLCGGGAFWDTYNVSILLDSMRRLNETEFPAVIYGGSIPPRATSDIAHTDKDKPVTIDVLENDYDGNGEKISLQAVQTSSDMGGSVAIKGGKAVYTPAPGFVGSDEFAYTVVDSAGVANRSGQVKVTVRAEGLAAHFDFEKTVKRHVDELIKEDPADPRLYYYQRWDYRPQEEKYIYLLEKKGPYDAGARPIVAWLDYARAAGVKGNSILNPGNLRNATVDLGNMGDPGHDSLSVSLWVCYPPGGGGRVIIGKGANPSVVQSGWTIQGGGAGKHFVFGGNTVRMRAGWIDPAPPEDVRMENEWFKLTAPEEIKPNQWYHLVMVMDRGKKQLRAWVNNQSVEDPEGQTAIPDGPIEHHGTLTLFNGHAGKWWDGTRAAVDEVKIFTSVLTGKQVAELYAEGKHAKVPVFPELPKPEAKK